MFEQFTKSARGVITKAQEEARKLKHNYIGTEHLLLGLLQLEEGVAVEALHDLGISYEKTYYAVEKEVGLGEEVSSRQIPFTPRAKKVLELSLREALSLSHQYIGAEHILLGLVCENEGVAIKLLENAGCDGRMVGEAVRARLSQHEKAVVSAVEQSDLGLLVQDGAIILTVMASEAGDDPKIKIFKTRLQTQRGEWTETFGSRERLEGYLEGLSSAYSMMGCFVHFGWRIPDTWAEPSGIRWIVPKDDLPRREDLNSEGKVITI